LLDAPHHLPPVWAGKKVSARKGGQNDGLAELAAQLTETRNRGLGPQG
jgi:hypothetical protein